YFGNSLPHASVVRQELLLANCQRGMHVPPCAVSGDTLVDFVNQLVDQPAACSQTQHEGSFGGPRTLLRLSTAIFFKAGQGSSQVARAEDGMANAADSFGRADLHGAFRHMNWRPELILVAVRIGEIDDRAFVAFRGRLYRIGVWDFMLIEPTQV